MKVTESQMSFFESAEPKKAKTVKRERVETIKAGQTTGKKKITTEAINEFFGIKESFELPSVLLKKLLNKQEKDELCREFMQFEFDMRNDCLRDYFQMNSANRNALKQDYTPDCLCHLISELAPKAEKVIDICSGTGALTIGINRDIQFQCEELSSMSIPVLLFNLALRGINATVLQKNVLLNQTEKAYSVKRNGSFSDVEELQNFMETKTDVVISNPPYSLKWEPKTDDRFQDYELAPAKASDYAFVLDGISRLTDTGQAFYILPHGVLFRGNAEGKIRKQLIENNLIDAVIGLPENMFLNTCIPVFVLVLNKAKQTDDVLFISAEKLCKKGGKQYVMTDEHIKQIADVYWQRKAVDKFSSVVSFEEIKKNDFSLNIPRYVDTYEREELPPLSEITKELIRANLEVRRAEIELTKMLRELNGDEEYNKVKDEFVEYFSSQDIVGETMLAWLQMKNLENRVDYITSHAKKERKQIFELATFERVKKRQTYEAGTVYIQLSATDGKVRFLTENQELDTKYGVFIPNKEQVIPIYLYYILDFEMESFLAKYQSGMNINPDIFKYLEVTYHPEQKYQRELAMTLADIDYQCNEQEKNISEWQDFKKYHLDGMFC